MPRKYKSSKREILQAAGRVILRGSVKRLTIQGVAEEAGLSKGGVLYHFGTKEALLEGMIRYLVEDVEERRQALEDQDPEPKGRFTRSYLRVTFPNEGEREESEQAMDASLLAAVALFPECLAPLYEQYEVWQKRFENDGLDAAVATLIRYAVDGLWLGGLFGIPALPQERYKAVLAKIESLIETS